jgi:hypothetical protein
LQVLPGTEEEIRQEQEIVLVPNAMIIEVLNVCEPKVTPVLIVLTRKNYCGNMR